MLIGIALTPSGELTSRIRDTPWTRRGLQLLAWQIPTGDAWYLPAPDDWSFTMTLSSTPLSTTTVNREPRLQSTKRRKRCRSNTYGCWRSWTPLDRSSQTPSLLTTNLDSGTPSKKARSLAQRYSPWLLLPLQASTVEKLRPLRQIFNFYGLLHLGSSFTR